MGCDVGDSVEIGVGFIVGATRAVDGLLEVATDGGVVTDGVGLYVGESVEGEAEGIIVGNSVGRRVGRPV